MGWDDGVSWGEVGLRGIRGGGGCVGGFDGGRAWSGGS